VTVAAQVTASSAIREAAAAVPVVVAGEGRSGAADAATDEEAGALISKGKQRILSRGLHGMPHVLAHVRPHARAALVSRATSSLPRSLGFGSLGPRRKKDGHAGESE